jgi:hypothetical protein
MLPNFSECGDAKLELLKLLAEMAPCGLKEETVKAAIEPTFKLLLVSYSMAVLCWNTSCMKHYTL